MLCKMKLVLKTEYLSSFSFKRLFHEMFNAYTICGKLFNSRRVLFRSALLLQEKLAFK